MSNSKQTDVILWSGGFDSTLTLVEQCKRYLEMDQLIYSDSVLLVVSLNAKLIGENKMKREYEARDKIKEFIKEEYGINLTFANIDISPEDELIPIDRSLGMGLHQIPIMLGSIFPIMPCNSTLYLSYLSTDDSGKEYVLKYINDVWNSLSMLVNKGRCEIKFPVNDLTKDDVLYKLYSHHPELLTMCTCCESSDDDRCGECTPCTTLRGTVKNIINDDYHKYSYHKEFVAHLRSTFNYLLEK